AQGPHGMLPRRSATEIGTGDQKHGTVRRQRVELEILAQGAAALRENSQAETVAELFAGKPFASSADAASAFDWLTAARKLSPDVAGINPLLALAGWSKNPPDQQAEQLARQVVGNTKPGDGSPRAELLLALATAGGKQSAQPALIAAVGDHAQLWRELHGGQSKQGAFDAAALKTLDEKLVGPGLKIAAKITGASTETLSQDLAALHGAKGLLFRRAKSDVKDRLRLGLVAYQTAAKLDPTRAEYLAGAAFFGCLQPKPDFEQVRRDAQQAIQLDKNQPDGHGALGVTALIQSRLAQGDRRKALWAQAASALDQAIQGCDNPACHPEMAQYLIQRSTLLVERSLAPDASFTSQDRDRSKALRDAEQAIDLAPDEPRAWMAKGHALEDVALLSNPADANVLSKAKEAFSKVISLDATAPTGYLARGRCSLTAALVVRGALERDGLMEQSLADLTQASRAGTPNKEAEFWLGQLHFTQADLNRSRFGDLNLKTYLSEFEKASEFFKQAVQANSNPARLSWLLKTITEIATAKSSEAGALREALSSNENKSEISRVIKSADEALTQIGQADVLARKTSETPVLAEETKGIKQLLREAKKVALLARGYGYYLLFSIPNTAAADQLAAQTKAEDDYRQLIEQFKNDPGEYSFHEFLGIILYKIGSNLNNTQTYRGKNWLAVCTESQRQMEAGLASLKGVPDSDPRKTRLKGFIGTISKYIQGRRGG
ncbi:MAG: hypothetical protein N2C14_31680, partial [Planctomycetales bacterium]